MKKILIFLTLLIIFSCSNENINTKNIETEEDIFYISNFNWTIELKREKENSWDKTLDYIYKNEKKLSLWFNKNNLWNLKNISKFDWEDLWISIWKDVNLIDFLEFLKWAKWELLKINKNFWYEIDSENAKIEISIEEAKILKSLDFKKIEIIVTHYLSFWELYCNDEVYNIIPRICDSMLFPEPNMIPELESKWSKIEKEIF